MLRYMLGISDNIVKHSEQKYFGQKKPPKGGLVFCGGLIVAVVRHCALITVVRHWRHIARCKFTGAATLLPCVGVKVALARIVVEALIVRFAPVVRCNVGAVSPYIAVYIIIG